MKAATAVVLGSSTLIDAAIGIGTSTRTSGAVHLHPALTSEVLAMERRSGPAFEPAVTRHAISRSDTVTETAAEGTDAIDGAVKTAPANCLACRPLSTAFDPLYFAQANGDEHRAPVTIPAAGLPDKSESAVVVSDAQQPADIAVADSETRSMGEPDLPLSPTGVQVRSLQQALSRTYQTNPTLMARRAELRGLDNAVALERSAGNLQISATSTFDQEVYITRRLGARGRNLRSNVDFSKVLFAGGRIRNATRSAQARVIAGRAELRATEGNILTEAVAAYADILRDREIRDLNQSQVSILLTNLESTRDRFRVRDLTLTDVAQSETRLEVARSNLVTAEGRLQASEANFERIVGARAGNLEPLPPLPPLPLSSELADETALANNASIAAFAARARAADYDVAVSRASRLPTLSVISTIDNDNALGTANSASGLPPGTVANSETNIAAGFTLRIPLYQGGAASARIRQNEEVRSQFIEEAIAVERLVLADVRTAFSIWRSTTRSISFNEQAVASSEKALESVKFEQTVGARSILDVLNAEQEFLNSKIALTSARRDAYVAAFELLNSMGASEAADLNFVAGPLYDPEVNYKEYSDTWSDWKDGTRRPPVSTRNVPAETDSPLTRLNDEKSDEFEPDD
jgi:outer membrane protein